MKPSAVTHIPTYGCGARGVSLLVMASLSGPRREATRPPSPQERASRESCTHDGERNTAWPGEGAGTGDEPRKRWTGNARDRPAARHEQWGRPWVPRTWEHGGLVPVPRRDEPGGHAAAVTAEQTAGHLPLPTRALASFVGPTDEPNPP
ncbi:hypothetical protein GCM10010420_12150 [Streptomyces glaucosporus]|uniref:Uncharacterized protein n=1 Tax=Streptomyces glaucosporus TaxID=284044 RepID=A0ABN3HX32_9ACTN